MQFTEQDDDSEYAPHSAAERADEDHFYGRQSFAMFEQAGLAGKLPYRYHTPCLTCPCMT